MKRLITTILAALALSASTAFAGGPSGDQNEDGGGGHLVGIYYVQSVTFVNGFPYYLTCEYLDFGTFVVQNRCW